MNIFNNDDTTDRSRAQVGIGTLIVFIAMVLVAAIAAGVLINTAGFLQTQAEDTGTESTSQVADNLNVITEVGQVGFEGQLANDADDFQAGDADKIESLRLGVQPAAGSDDVNLAELTMQYVSDDDFANIVAGHEIGEVNEIETDEGDIDVDEDSGFVNEWHQDDFEERDEDTRAGGDTNPDNLLAVPGEVNYLVEPVTAEDDSDLVMTDNADRYEIVIPLDDTLTGFFDSDEDTRVDTIEDGDIEVIDFQDSGTDLDTIDDETIQPGVNVLNEGDNVELTITTEVGAQTIAFLQVPDSLSAEEDKDTVNL